MASRGLLAIRLTALVSLDNSLHVSLDVLLHASLDVLLYASLDVGGYFGSRRQSKAVGVIMVTVLVLVGHTLCSSAARYHALVKEVLC